MQSQIEMVEVSLKTPSTPNTPNSPSTPAGQRFEKATEAVLTYVLGDAVRDASDEDHHQAQDNVMEELMRRRNRWRATRYEDGKPHLRYFAVGPSTYQIRCPLCKQRADTETVQMSGILGHLSCLLSTLSCCFPLFSLSFVYMCLQSRLKSKRLFCNKCGGHLGFYWRPT